jgi:hypothetical protein
MPSTMAIRRPYDLKAALASARLALLMRLLERSLKALAATTGQPVSPPGPSGAISGASRRVC